MKYRAARHSALLAVAALAAALHAPPASAVALGPLKLLSRLGEPLIGEVDLPQLTIDELAILRAGVGARSDYEAFGMQLDPSLDGMKLVLLRRAEGRYYLRLVGQRPVTATTLDVILQLQAGAQSVWRDYSISMRPAEPQSAGLALGLARVLSRQGEPLHAEIDVPVSPGGSASGVRVGVAGPEEYAAAGIAYNPALADVRLKLEDREGGRKVLSVTSDKPIDEPLLNLVMDASWSAGRLVRDYSLPLPPRAETQPAAPPVQRAAAGTVNDMVAAAPAPAVQPTVTAVPPPLAVASASAAGRKVRVQPGETASQIAMAHKGQEVSLDQMLVALLNTNPSAFMGGNVNRLRAGALLAIPSQADVQAVTVDESSRVLGVQAREFDEFRRRLAENATPARPGVVPPTVTQAAAPSARKVVRSKLAISNGGLAGFKDTGALGQQLQLQAERATQLTKEMKALAAAQAALQPPGAASSPAAVRAEPAASAATRADKGKSS